jgi:predicted HicB family RNase H-like nuclease
MQEKMSPRTTYPLRLDPEVRARVEKEAARQDRSLQWVLDNLLKQALGLKEVA